jgi:hypothetical protein
VNIAGQNPSITLAPVESFYIYGYVLDYLTGSGGCVLYDSFIVLLFLRPADEGEWNDLLRSGLNYGGGAVTSEELLKAIEGRIERTLMRTVSYSTVILYSEHSQWVMCFKLRLLSSASFTSQKKLRPVVKKDYIWWN